MTGCNHAAYLGKCPYCHADLRTDAERKLDADLRQIAERAHARMKEALGTRKYPVRLARKPENPA
jgi:glutaredoxin